MEMNNDIHDNSQAVSDKRSTYFIEMIAINRDSNMTRIYSCIAKPDSIQQFDADENDETWFD